MYGSPPSHLRFLLLLARSGVSASKAAAKMTWPGGGGEYIHGPQTNEPVESTPTSLFSVSASLPLSLGYGCDFSLPPAAWMPIEPCSWHHPRPTSSKKKKTPSKCLPYFIIENTLQVQPVATAHILVSIYPSMASKRVRRFAVYVSIPSKWVDP